MRQVQPGLRENAGLFFSLVLINAFVGGMVGMERTILPMLAQEQFHMSAHTAVFSFIVVFGIVKALSNYYAGTLANRIGRKKLLVWGWIIALPIPFLLIYAENWYWVIVANVLLGINQGLAWSSTVVMKIDIVGEKQRGLAMGLNEFAGYLAVALIAWFTGWIAGQYGIIPYPFYTGIILSVGGLLMSLFLVPDTRTYVQVEAMQSKLPRQTDLFWQTTWKHRVLGSVTQAGLVNNLNDGMAWGLFPVYLASLGYSIRDIGLVSAVYPAVWGIAQLFTGALSDMICKRNMLYLGMGLQGLVLMLFPWAGSLVVFLILAALLGLGTAMVYPVFLSTISAHTHPRDRAGAIGVFRLWRDAGYAIGAILSGLLADAFGLRLPIIVVGTITILSGLVIYFRMRCTD